jgi:hypothetical protein
VVDNRVFQPADVSGVFRGTFRLITMHPYSVSAPALEVIAAYAKWKELNEVPLPTMMADGWTLPSLRFAHLYEAHAAALDLAMVSGSVHPYRPHDVLITEFHGTPPEDET